MFRMANERANQIVEAHLRVVLVRDETTAEGEKVRREGGKVATFDFLGFTHYCDKTRRGKFKLGRKTSSQKFRQKMKAVNQWLKRVRNQVTLAEWWKVYRLKLLGHYRYYGISGNMPALRQFYRETSRRFSQHGYLAICPDIYCRFGHGLPAEVAALARSAGGVSDDSVAGDCDGAMKYLRALPYSNGKVGIIGTCSGGRHSFLVACRIKGLSAAVDCWGGKVVAAKEELPFSASTLGSSISFLSRPGRRASSFLGIRSGFTKARESPKDGDCPAGRPRFDHSLDGLCLFIMTSFG
jgi:hypothetical protein